MKCIYQSVPLDFQLKQYQNGFHFTDNSKPVHNTTESPIFVCGFIVHLLTMNIDENRKMYKNKINWKIFVNA